MSASLETWVGKKVVVFLPPICYSPDGSGLNIVTGKLTANNTISGTILVEQDEGKPTIINWRYVYRIELKN